MCYGCWEDAGKPTQLPATGKLCARLIDRLYDLPGGACGGNLHIVTDDWNLEDDNIGWCHQRVVTALMGTAEDKYTDVHPEQNAVELAICLLLAAMTEPERHATMAYQSEFIDDAGKVLVEY